MKLTSELTRLHKENEQLRSALKDLQSNYLDGFNDGYKQASIAAGRIIDILTDKIRVSQNEKV